MDAGLGGSGGNGDCLLFRLSMLVEAVTPMLPMRGLIVFDSMCCNLIPPLSLFLF